MRISKEKFSDNKKNILGETLNNIRIIKLFGWEDFFQQKILQTRELEMNAFSQLLTNSAIESAFNNMVP